MYTFYTKMLDLSIENHISVTLLSFAQSRLARFVQRLQFGYTFTPLSCPLFSRINTRFSLLWGFMNNKKRRHFLPPLNIVIKFYFSLCLNFLSMNSGASAKASAFSSVICPDLYSLRILLSMLIMPPVIEALITVSIW